MEFDSTINRELIRERLAALAPADGATPDVSVVVPVNAQGDLHNVVRLTQDIAQYAGSAKLEVIFVVNNFPPDSPPAELPSLQELGVHVLAIPNVRRPGEAVGFSARIPGVRAARSECVVLFDADCRVPDATALLDWYRRVMPGAQAAYTRVAFYDFDDTVSLHVRFMIHHAARWVKRNVLRIPTTRGSNYTVRRSTMLELYEAGMLADEMNVGPTFKRMKGRVVYSGRPRLRVYTSARMYQAGWQRIVPYILKRLRYNLRVLRVRQGVAAVTGRRESVRRYVNNRPVRDS